MVVSDMHQCFLRTLKYINISTTCQKGHTCSGIILTENKFVLAGLTILMLSPMCTTIIN